jgi:hypothetical protein
MDDIERNRMEHRQKKYRNLYRHENYARAGGIFSKKKRKQLLGFLEKSGGTGKTKSNFWYDTRETVKTALVDLELFLETADNKNVNQVLNVDSLTSVIDALFDTYGQEKDPTRVMVAFMLIERSFWYLRAISQKYLMPTQERQIEDAINLAKQLALLVLPEEKRSSFLNSGGRQL